MQFLKKASTYLLVMIVPSFAVGEANAKKTGLAKTAQAQAQTIEKAQAHLSARLAKLAEAKGRKIVRSSRSVGHGLTIVQASIDGAYPGTGVYTMLLSARGVSYGVHGKKDLADLVRLLGWLKVPPKKAALVQLVNLAHFNGMLAYSEEDTITVKHSRAGLELTLPIRAPMSGRPDGTVIARFRQTGTGQVKLIRGSGNKAP